MFSDNQMFCQNKYFYSSIIFGKAIKFHNKRCLKVDKTLKP